MENLSSMKYAELRSLAKKAGIKGNQKQGKLIAELTKHFVQQSAAKKPSTPKPSAKKRRSTFEKAPTPDLSVPKVITPAKGRNNVGKAATPRLATPVMSSPRSGLMSTSKALTPKVNTPAKGRINVGKVPTPKLATPVISTSPRTGKTSTGKVLTPKLNTPAKRRYNLSKSPTPRLATPVVSSPRTSRTSSDKAKTKSPKVHAGSGSPGVKDMLGAMKSEMTDEEMKDSLMSVIDQKVQKKAKDAPAPSSIPRFVAFVKSRQQAKPITPGNKDWEKIHKKNFSKFDSIDVYLNKKRKRAEDMVSSVKKAKIMVEAVTKTANKLKAHKTPTTPLGNENKKPRLSHNRNRTTPFKPTVFTTNKLNLNFGAKAAPKTLPHKSPKSVFGSSVKKASSTTEIRKSTGTTMFKEPTTTPFKFTAAPTAGLNATMSTTKKFDLKASLAKPLSWKPHKGKLRPMDANNTGTKQPVSAAKTKIRDDTRMTVAQRRAMKKQDAQMARRGIKI